MRQYATNQTVLGDATLPDDDQPDPVPAAEAEKPESRGTRINRLFREAIRDLAALRQPPDLAPDKDTD